MRTRTRTLPCPSIFSSFDPKIIFHFVASLPEEAAESPERGRRVATLGGPAIALLRSELTRDGDATSVSRLLFENFTVVPRPPPLMMMMIWEGVGSGA